MPNGRSWGSSTGDEVQAQARAWETLVGAAIERSRARRHPQALPVSSSTAQSVEVAADQFDGGLNHPAADARGRRS